MSNWIPISERLPTREDADERGEVVWKWADGTTCTGRGDEPTAVAWLPLPPYTPPKPGPTDSECDHLFSDTIDHAGPPGECVKFWREAVKRWFAAVTARIEKEKGK